MVGDLITVGLVKHASKIAADLLPNGLIQLENCRLLSQGKPVRRGVLRLFGGDRLEEGAKLSAESVDDD